MGTLSYMSPEQIRRAKDVTPRSDIFSLGAMLYELATGSLPFEGGDDFDVMEKIVHGRFRGVVMAQIPDFLKDVGEERRAAELSKRLDQVNQKQAEIYRMVQPTTWRYELKAAQ